MLIQEALGYDRFGRWCISKEEMEADQKFVLSLDFSLTKHDFHKPLESYQDGKKSFQRLVQDRYQDEQEFLKKKYQDFFKFPKSRQFQEYLRLKQEQEKDYQAQERWVGFYNSYDKNLSTTKLESVSASGFGAVLTSIGALGILSSSSEGVIMASLAWTGALYEYYNAYHHLVKMKESQKAKDRIKMVLQDWHQPDRFARYDRSLLNDKLQKLDKEKPTQIRQNKKRDLVAQYRLNHPKER